MFHDPAWNKHKRAGVLSYPATQAFQRSGSTLAEPHFVFEPVESLDGKPVTPDPQETHSAYLMIASVISLIVACMAVSIHIGQRRAERLRARSAGI